MFIDSWWIWHLFLPDKDYSDRLTHGSRVKVHVKSALGEHDRIPSYIQRVIQETETEFTGQYWSPPNAYQWKHKGLTDIWRDTETSHYSRRAEGLRIYEAHIGMAQEDEKVGTFTEFTQNVLPRIADLGYNTIQLMAIKEHPYYASFGYHV